MTQSKVDSFDGVPIVFSAAGEGETAVVLVHGWACDRTFWAGQVEPLAAVYRVVSLDLPGHGDSGTGRDEWTMAAFGRDVLCVADELGLHRLILVGHSMGGSVALEAVPLLEGRVLGLVGVDTMHDAGSSFNPAFWRRHVQALEDDFVARCSELARWMFRDDADPDLVERIRARMCATEPRAAIGLMWHIGDYDVGRAMQKVGVPIRCINSPTTPTNIGGNRAFAPSFDAEIMDGVGHFPMLDRPAAFNRILMRVLGELAAPS